MQDSTFIGRYLPQRFSDRNGACEKGYYCDIVVVSAGVTLVAAQAGKSIFVPSMIIAPGAAGRTQVSFLSDITLQCSVKAPLPTDPLPSVILPFNEAGYVCTLPGQALKVNVGTDSALISFPYFVFQV
jgi:hypothetical protein